MSIKKDVTTLLLHAEGGDSEAYEELVLRVYDELRALAQKYLHLERKDHALVPTTLEPTALVPTALVPTALVHEAYMHLVDQTQIRWKNRAQFFRVAANMMRRVLIDHARRHLARKRGGDGRKVTLSLAEGIGLGPGPDILTLDEALEEFASFDPQKAGSWRCTSSRDFPWNRSRKRSASRSAPWSETGAWPEPGFIDGFRPERIDGSEVCLPTPCPTDRCAMRVSRP